MRKATEKKESRTIEQFLIQNELRMAKERKDKLIELGAPEVIVKSAEAEIERLEKGVLRIGGDVELLKEQVETFVMKTGRGGEKVRSD